MKISVAMCTYNGETYLQQQLDSFVNQVRRPDEIVVCDDASNDATLSILQAFAERAPFSVKVVRNETNLGSTGNFVKAISLCGGDLIALSDQDDVWKAEKLQTLAPLLESDAGLGGVFSDGLLIDSRSQPTGQMLWRSLGYTSAMQAELRRGQPLQVLKRQNFITGATLMFRSTLRKYFAEIPHNWVHDAWITWKLAIHSRVIGVPLPLIYYRIHAANQIGINEGSAGSLLRSRTATQVENLLEEEIERLLLLQANIAEVEDYRSAEARRVATRRLHYLFTRRNAILQAKLVRPLYVLAAWPAYLQFGKGLRSMLGDLLL